MIYEAISAGSCWLPLSLFTPLILAGHCHSSSNAREVINAAGGVGAWLADLRVIPVWYYGLPVSFSAIGLWLFDIQGESGW
jgi:hypothetical protein